MDGRERNAFQLDWKQRRATTAARLELWWPVGSSQQIYYETMCHVGAWRAPLCQSLDSWLETSSDGWWIPVLEKGGCRVQSS